MVTGKIGSRLYIRKYGDNLLDSLTEKLIAGRLVTDTSPRTLDYSEFFFDNTSSNAQ